MTEFLFRNTAIHCIQRNAIYDPKHAIKCVRPLDDSKKRETYFEVQAKSHPDKSHIFYIPYIETANSSMAVCGSFIFRQNPP